MMLSGSFNDLARRMDIASFLISPVSSITEILSEIKDWSFSSSSSSIEGFAKSSISVITLMNNSASSSSFNSSEGIVLPLAVRKMTAFVSSTKRFLFIPLVSKFSLISHSITVGVRGKNAKIVRNRFTVRVSGFFLCRLQGFFDSGVAASGQKRTFFHRSIFFCGGRGKRKDSPPYRNFRGNINNKPATGRYINSLSNGHAISIA